MTIIVVKEPTDLQTSAFINFVAQSGMNGVAVIENVDEFHTCNDDGRIICTAKAANSYESGCPQAERVRTLEQKVDYLMSAESDRINAQLGSAINSNITTEIFDAIFGRTDHDNHD